MKWAAVEVLDEADVPMVVSDISSLCMLRLGYQYIRHPEGYSVECPYFYKGFSYHSVGCRSLRGELSLGDWSEYIPEIDILMKNTIDRYVKQGRHDTPTFPDVYGKVIVDPLDDPHRHDGFYKEKIIQYEKWISHPKSSWTRLRKGKPYYDSTYYHTFAHDHWIHEDYNRKQTFQLIYVDDYCGYNDIFPRSGDEIPDDENIRWLISEKRVSNFEQCMMNHGFVYYDNLPGGLGGRCSFERYENLPSCKHFDSQLIAPHRGEVSSIANP